MQKRQRRSFSEVVRGIFNVRVWVGADWVRSFWAFILTSARRMLVPNSQQKSERDETFAEAQARLAISDEDLNSQGNALLRMSILLFSIGVLLFFYAIFQLVYGSLHGFILTLSLVGLAWVIAFRYHFWSFQIKYRKLGCSLREWYRYGLRGEKQ